MARTGIGLVLVMAATMWVLEVVDLATGHALDAWGIVPRTVDGLIGIGAAPFLHFGFGHLALNTVGFVVLGSLIALGGAVRVATVTALAAVISGLGVWLLSPSTTVTAGASGVVFGYAAYLIVRGIVSRRVAELALGVAVVVVFGGSLLVGLLPQAGISWLGHLFGALGGALAARLLHRRDVARPQGRAARSPTIDR